ncbi:MAG: glycosyltransferase, partial [Cyclobacteriaceae bacterium]|nr:glycosyltransferase [Cyclobacteriaceae bacterium]
GISKKVFLEAGGFHQTNLGEDVELSMRLLEKSCRTALIEKAFVYHKRRTSLAQFYKQAFSFGQGRVLSGRKKKGGIKLVHLFPLLFTLFLIIWPILWWIHPILFLVGGSGISIYLISIGIFSTVESRNPVVGLLSILTALIQLTGYGGGFLIEYIKQAIKS